MRSCAAALGAAGLAVVVLAGSAAAAAAPVGTITQYGNDLLEGTWPYGIAAGADGNLWFVKYNDAQVGRIDPDDGTITQYPVPSGEKHSTGIAAGRDGNLWFTESTKNLIGRIEPDTGKITEYDVPTPDSQPTGITAGPDGKLWFTEAAAGKIASIDPPTKEIHEYAVPTTGEPPYGITAGPDGNLWFTESDNTGKFPSQVGRLDPDTGHIDEYPAGDPGSGLLNIVAGPDGNLWFTELTASKIGRIDPNTGVVKEYATPAPDSEPWTIAAGPDGNLWFTEFEDPYGHHSMPGAIGRVDPATGAITEYRDETSPLVGPEGIAAGPDGNMWFTQLYLGIGRIISSFTPPPPPPPPTPPSGSGSGSCASLAVSGVSPSAGLGGDAVTISGSGFACATGVLFGDTPALGFNVDGPGQITARVPLLGPGAVDVRVLIGDQVSPVAPGAVFTESSVPADDASVSPARVLVCGRVPSLTRYTLAQARRVLVRDGCRVSLGVRGRKARRGHRHITAQTPKAGTPLYVGDPAPTVRFG